MYFQDNLYFVQLMYYMDKYKISYVTSSLEKVANGVKLVPSFMIDEKNHQMTKEFFTYICPIVGAENKVHLKINSKILKK